MGVTVMPVVVILFLGRLLHDSRLGVRTLLERFRCEQRQVLDVETLYEALPSDEQSQAH